MVQTLVTLTDYQDRIVSMVKATHGLKSKSDAVGAIIDEYSDEYLERRLRSEFVRKLLKIDKEPAIPFKNVDELRKMITKANKHRS